MPKTLQPCPRCESRFGRQADLEIHLESDHGVSLYPPWAHDRTTERSSPVWGRVAVPVNPLRTHSRAVSVAAALAEQSHMGVDVIAVTPPYVGARVTEDHLEERVQDLDDAGADAVAWHRLDGDDVTGAILSFVSDSDVTMLCMDSQSRGSMAEFALGSISQDVVRRSPVPVLLVGPRVVGPSRTTTMVVGVDDSDAAVAAVDAAAALAARLSADLVLIQVREGSADARSTVLEDSIRLRQLARRLPTSRTTVEVRYGRDPARVIVEVAARAPGSMIVMGTHGRVGLQRLVRGSVALDVVRSAPCPVLVVRQAWPSEGLDGEAPV